MEENALTETGGEWLGLVSLLLADSLLSMLSVSLVFSPGARPWLGVQANTGPPGPPASTPLPPTAPLFSSMSKLALH